MSDLFKNHIIGFLITRLYLLSLGLLTVYGEHGDPGHRAHIAVMEGLRSDEGLVNILPMFSWETIV